jgi:CPA1 family monovalent cation:H+ antiporter
MVSATDPVAVLSTFKQIGAPPRLATMVEGESLLNDGTAIVLFVVAVRTVGAPVSPWDAVLTFCVTVVASVAIGAATGFAGSRLLVLIDDHLIELMMSVFLAYGT